MSLIAGYLGDPTLLNYSRIEDFLRSYPIIADGESGKYENLIIKTKAGWLIRKLKKDYPVQVAPRTDPNGATLMMLGFQCAAAGVTSPKILKESEGEFVAVYIEADSTAHIINDRFASRPCYILRKAKGLYFSSNLAFLLEFSGERCGADISSWLHVFSFGHTLNAATTFTEIKRMPPATHLIITPDGAIREECYWRLEYQPDEGLDPGAHCGDVFEAFQAGVAVRSRMAGKGVIALSGGLDSRLVAGALPVDVDFSAFTFVNAGEGCSTPDTTAAAEVAKVLGLRHHVQSIPRQEYSAVATDVIRLTGGMRPFHHMATVMPYIRELRARQQRFLLGGGPGDIMAGSRVTSIPQLDPRSTDRLVRDYCLGLANGAEHLRLLFRKAIAGDCLREVYRSLLNSFTVIDGPTAAHRITTWVMLHRQPAFTFTSVMHTHPDVSEAFCHLGYAYVDLMLKLPAEWLYQRNFYGFMIHRCLPALRAIVYANTGRPLSGELQHINWNPDFRKRSLALGARFARKVTPTMIKRLMKPTPRGRPSFHYSLYREDQKLLETLRECIHSIAPLREVLDAEKCSRFLDNFSSDNLKALPYSTQTELMGGLTTLCLTYKTLMG